MPHRYRSRLMPATAMIAACIAAVAPTALAGAAPASFASERAAAGAWLSGQLVDGQIPFFGNTDWGLTIDVLIALEATGADPDAADEITDAVAAHVDSYATDGDFGDPDTRHGANIAKILYAAEVADQDPSDFGGHDMRQLTLDQVASDGWLKDSNASGLTAGANMFGQAFAVLGLARSGGVPQPVVDFLISQQCPAGGFRLLPGADGGSCADAPTAEQIVDPDTTGMAVQALLAADEAGATGAKAAADKGGDWLLSVQKANGTFHGSVFTDYPNSNSTGLAGQALAALGKADKADLAAQWVTAQQLKAGSSGAASAHNGAIAYTPDALTDAIANGVPEFQLDQWRRSTPQAVLVLAQIPLGEIGIAEPPTSSPSPSTSPSASTSASASASPAPGGGLPVTGPEAAALAAFGLTIVVIGAALVVAARRRDTDTA